MLSYVLQELGVVQSVTALRPTWGGAKYAENQK